MKEKNIKIISGVRLARVLYQIGETQYVKIRDEELDIKANSPLISMDELDEVITSETIIDNSENNKESTEEQLLLEFDIRGREEN